MQNTLYFDKINNIDSLKQEILFLKQKYSKFTIPQDILNFFSLKDESLKNLIWNDWNNDKTTIFQLFKAIDNNERLIKQIIHYTKFFELNEVFERITLSQEEYKKREDEFSDIIKNWWKKEDFKTTKDDEIKIRINIPVSIESFFNNPDKSAFIIQSKTTKQVLSKDDKIRTKEQIDIHTDLVLYDILKLNRTQINLEKAEKEELLIDWNKVKVWKLTSFYRKQVLWAIIKDSRTKRAKNNNNGFNYDNWSDESDIIDLYWIKNNNINNVNEDIKHLAWQYNFFKMIQNSVSDKYIFSHSDLLLINDIVEDLKKWKVVLLTWDTWSGKTELARFLCKKFLKTSYIFVSGNKDIEVSDLTLEKTITSKSPLSLEKNIVSKDITNEDEFLAQEAERVFRNILSQESFKAKVLELAKNNNKTEKDIELIKRELENMELTKKSLITEYHLMGIFLAAENWVPCIIDEMNLMRQEIFMALNDHLTKKIWQTVSLPNALWRIEVKKWFCVILTWNDPEQNSNIARYSKRYNIDEASYNRLRVYAKNYFNQINKTHNQNKLDSIENTYNYLNENELYWVMLMMMFDSKTNLNHAWKYWFEVMKKDFEWNHLNKNNFFSSLKQFAIAISQIQKAYSWETINLAWSFSALPIKDMIKRKVFSMRNLLEVLEAYKNDTLPLDYHIYNEFIKHTVNEKEKYWLLVIFKQFWFFGYLVTDNQESSNDNLHKKRNELLLQKDKLKLKDIENKIIITKQDLYTEYFGAFGVEDEFFQKNNNSIQNITEENDDYEWNILDNIEITQENLEEIFQEILGLIDEVNDESKIDTRTYMLLTAFYNHKLELINSWKIQKINYKKLHHLANENVGIYREFLEEDSSNIDEQQLVKLTLAYPND